jgi:hypothetical protein
MPASVLRKAGKRFLTASTSYDALALLVETALVA